MAQLGGHAIYLTDDVVLGARESVRDVARNLERFVDGIVVRTGPHEVAVELAAQADDPGHQRPDAPRASVPGARRRVHDAASGSGDLRRARRRVRRRRQQRLPLAGAARRRARDGGPAGPSGRLRPERADRGAGPGARRGVGRPARRSGTIRSRPYAARPSSTPTPGPRWARRPRPRSAATRSPGSRSTTPCSTPPVPMRSRCTACPAHRGEEITVGGHGRTA